MYPQVPILQQRQASLKRRHPWIFASAIAKDPGLESGQVVDVVDTRGAFLARGYYNQKSQIRIRLLTWDKSDLINATFWKQRLQASIERRQALLASSQTTACRLVSSDADGLPGLIVDRYGSTLVIQILTAGMEVQRQEIIQALADLQKPEAIYERSDDAARTLEGLAPRIGLAYGTPATQPQLIQEHGLKFVVDTEQGHKTGFYIDQRDNRQLVAAYAAGKRILNCFCYTGGFSIAALKAGAREVTSIDSSQPALDLLAENLRLNQLPANDGQQHQAIADNVFEVLRRFVQEARRFDLIILDPPKFIHNARQIDKATRAYKDLNLLAFKLLNPGGLLATFSCSGHMPRELFQKVVFGAALDAHADAQIMYHLSQAWDHPVLLTFPESAYLKGLLCRKL